MFPAERRHMSIPTAQNSAVITAVKEIVITESIHGRKAGSAAHPLQVPIFSMCIQLTAMSTTEEVISRLAKSALQRGHQKMAARWDRVFLLVSPERSSSRSMRIKVILPDHSFTCPFATIWRMATGQQATERTNRTYCHGTGLKCFNGILRIQSAQKKLTATMQCSSFKRTEIHL